MTLQDTPKPRKEKLRHNNKLIFYEINEEACLKLQCNSLNNLDSYTEYVLQIVL